ncbi:GntR family transcriptional regulator [Neobacillus sp. OS1-32]|uniref:GntR family transcriptional regulator n=1 Tax=Neobacillus sp. OS1-32 TaxID=3070682 RepID=UPI0027E09956|nr:GntR family transcriptional regulator [Neobacillus sp. OS1-32]WML31751.1 GntR family transcriptional regulator [Neobacillus sp. OS1-32]
MRQNNQNQSISKTQYAYEYLRTQILDGYYGPGQRIIIDQVAKELVASTIPVREAIRQLEVDGLIQYKPYSGAIVSVINEIEYIETLSVVAVLDGYATALSSQNIKESHIEKLKELNKQMEDALHQFEFEQFGVLNRQFHATIYQECGNSFLQEEIRQAQLRLDRVRRSIFTFVPQRARQSIEEHAKIIRLIERKAPKAEIEEVVRQHRFNTITAFKNRMISGQNKND